ncbi:Uncharacterised protein [Rodentibacter pneumotropicus]|uniref:AsmA family protein n=1 Tax=Rodentibacter pneumotropicus TaxID=758 RepID=A0A448MJ22_9PAST|nr:Uncharacterised protein [Rodentibacter pneumotropicus]
MNLPFDIHVPSLVAKDWQYVSQNEQSEELQRITLQDLILQADAIGHDVQLKKLALESSLGNLTSQGLLRLNGDFPVNLTLTSKLNAIQSEGKEIFPKSDVQFSLSGSLKKRPHFL